MSIERRISEIEKKTGVKEDPIFLIVNYVTTWKSGGTLTRKPTEKALEKAQKEALEKNPRQRVYFLVEFDDWDEEVVPPLGLPDALEST